VARGPDRLRDADGPSVYERLVDVKTKYDPDNVYHHNQNIRRVLSEQLAKRASWPTSLALALRTTMPESRSPARRQLFMSLSASPFGSA
jgi:hypothetical protein